MPNFFSSPWFLDAAASVFFPQEGAHIGTVEVHGRCYDVLLRRDGAPAHLPLVDYFEPCSPGESRPASATPTPSLRAVAHELVEVTGLDFDAGPWTPAPRVDWRVFPDWVAFTKRCAGRSRNAFKRHARKVAALAQEVGPTRFSLDDPDHGLLETALFWKSRQLRATGRPDRFASLRNRQLLHLLLDRGDLKLAVLFAGGEPLAMELGHDDAQAHSAWITAYNVEFSRYSPGILLFERIMQASWERGQACFDFLAGGDPYKYHYATHAWLVGPAGQPPPHERARARARAWITDHSDTTGVRKGAFQVARWALQRRLDREGAANVTRDAPWMEALERNQQDWPHGHLADPAACQLQALLAWGARDASALSAATTRAMNAARGIGRVVLPPPTGNGAAASGRDRLDLIPGEYVRVRAIDEIAATLTTGSADGIHYMKLAMNPFAGRVLRVERVVGRFYDERTGRVVRPRGAVMLDGAHCDGSPYRVRGGCDRRCPLFWSEDWLERVDAPAPSPGPAPAPAQKPSRPPFQVGDHVRVRPSDEISRAGDAGGVRFAPTLMGRFAGRVFRVCGRAYHAFDAHRREVFPMDGPLLLEGVQCPGVPLVGGGRCDRGCTLLWREAWLEGIGEGE
ncbi:MAG: GNAT family N-acetyltransferase [Pseudomonadota bacterium]